MKEKVLYLCHRIPFPANKGDKIPTCNILKFLSQRFDVYLGCFIDNPYDLQYREEVSAFCKATCFVTLNPKLAKVKGLSAVLSSKPITLPYYYDSMMKRWVDSTIAEQGISKAFVYSSSMAQYVINNGLLINKVMDFADIDSDKWRQYADKSKGLMRWIYRREHQTLEKYEKYVTDKFDTSCFVTDAETKLFCEMIKSEDRSKVVTLSNGIDTTYFSPQAEAELDEDYPLANDNYIVFTGVMDYWANIDAVKWFIHAVWPAIYQQQPDSKFYIVGSSPSKDILNLKSIPGIVVTGRVKDVRPYLKHAKACIAPMQIARGIQNKILEAMAMERPVITTSRGIEGIDNYPRKGVFVTDSASQHVEWLLHKLQEPTVTASSSRQWLEENYSWEAKLHPLLSFLGTANHE